MSKALIRCRHCRGGFHGVGTVDPQTFILERTVIPLDKRIFVRTLGWADRNVHAQTHPETQERRGELALLGGTDKACVAVDRHRLWQPVLLHNLSNGAHGRVGREIRAHLRIEQNGGATIHRVQLGHHMLLLAMRICRHRRDILEVELPVRQWGRSRDGCVIALPIGNTPILP